MTFSNQELITLLLAAIGGGVGVSLVAQLVKRTFGLQSEAVIHTVVVALAVVTGGLQYILQIQGQLPPEIMGVSTMTIYGFSQILYKYVKYTSDFVGKVNAYNEGQKAAQAVSQPLAPVAPAASTPSPTAPVVTSPAPAEAAPIGEFQF